MAKLEQLELDARRAQLVSDVKALVDKYRAIFGWDVPDIDDGCADTLILAAIRQALNRIEQAQADAAPR
ncbi:hypothetical protein [Ottowia sp.]|jgi:hypothetical protein|uniref:hypothetical protein n=1 Tax=Ottowia sp. TaxID=1898956 RepID=UPI0025CE80B7|nr:hypothetical protein [Ottowia sp.]MBK6615966.1 hypothetical protein [Ottowia sp.]MBK6747088.1 hypothetical protein [Ottowia sp.]